MKSSHVSAAETGYPGMPITGLCCTTPSTTGWPGRTATPWTTSCPKVSDSSGGVVFGAGRGTGIDHHDVRRCYRCQDGLFEALIVVRNGGPACRPATPFCHHGAQHEGVELDNIAWSGFGTDGDEFCASGDDRDVRWLAYRHCSESSRRTGGEILRPEAMTPWQHQLCRHDVFSQRTHVLVGRDRSLDLDGGRIDLVDDLDHDDRVKAWLAWGRRYRPTRLARPP